jgi:hypothetical protein
VPRQKKSEIKRSQVVQIAELKCCLIAAWHNVAISELQMTHFSLIAPHCVTQKPTFQRNQAHILEMHVNMTLTNQRTDSFSPPGVNLEAKI